MFTTNFVRVIKWGWVAFWRNSWVSFATLIIVVITLFTLTGLLILKQVENKVVANLREKVDISVYFEQNTPEEEILKVQSDLGELDGVKNIEYISKETALEDFKKRHQDNPILLESLEEIEENPLQASLNIKATLASQYEAIAKFLEREEYKPLVAKINYWQNQEIINKLFSITEGINRAGIIFSVVLLAITLLVTLNTVRLAIYSQREEIEIMRLVGASNWYISGPFLMQGILIGIFSALITIGISWGILSYFSPGLSGFFPGINVFAYFQSNIFSIFLLELGVGIILGVLSSFIAIRRYLKI